MEKEILGIYLSGHPLLEFETELSKKVNFHIGDKVDDGKMRDDMRE